MPVWILHFPRTSIDLVAIGKRRSGNKTLSALPPRADPKSSNAPSGVNLISYATISTDLAYAVQSIVPALSAYTRALDIDIVIRSTELLIHQDEDKPLKKYFSD